MRWKSSYARRQARRAFGKYYDDNFGKNSDVDPLTRIIRTFFFLFLFFLFVIFST